MECLFWNLKCYKGMRIAKSTRYILGAHLSSTFKLITYACFRSIYKELSRSSARNKVYNIISEWLVTKIVGYGFCGYWLVGCGFGLSRNLKNLVAVTQIVGYH